MVQIIELYMDEIMTFLHLTETMKNKD